MPGLSWFLVPRHATLTLLALVALLYGQTAWFEWLIVDDTAYIVKNPMVSQGLTLEGLSWAFSNDDFALWAPLTWLSLMLDVTLFGVHSGMAHVENVLFHAANVLLLYHFLHRATHAPGRSFLVAALLAVHPLHAESVAWVVERKDVLFLFFMLLGFHAWLSHVRWLEGTDDTPAKGARSAYGRVLLCFALAMLAKPMAVSFPLLLLLLDRWPLGRTASWRALIWEKLPLWLLVVVLSGLAMGAASDLRAASEAAPLGQRLSSAVIGYAFYLWHGVWPKDLGLYYAFRLQALTPFNLALSLTLLGGVTLLAWRVRREVPALAMGWVWYLVALLPALGILAHGEQAWGDRFAYLPMIGIYLGAVWGVHHAAQRPAWCRFPLAAAGATVLALLTLLSWKQIGVWNNTESLYLHTLQATGPNPVIRRGLGKHYQQRQEWEKALEQYQGMRAESIRGKSFYQASLIYLAQLATKAPELRERIIEDGRREGSLYFRAGLEGAILHYEGRYAEALPLLEQALTEASDNMEIKELVALAAYGAEQFPRARELQQEVLQSDPKRGESRWRLARTLNRLKEPQAALDVLLPTLRERSEDPQVHYQAALALLGLGRLPQAGEGLQEALRLAKGEFPEAKKLLEEVKGMAKLQPMMETAPAAVRDKVKQAWDKELGALQTQP
ncbi:MAG: tetratricopeptide repeat protein [Magnetococcales bacterium]|nr:tetratricopeptide repeat protein [Magnetococcales bacterium]